MVMVMVMLFYDNSTIVVVVVVVIGIIGIISLIHSIIILGLLQ